MHAFEKHLIYLKINKNQKLPFAERHQKSEKKDGVINNTLEGK